MLLLTMLLISATPANDVPLQRLPGRVERYEWRPELVEPPGFRVVSRPRWGLFALGGSLLAAGLVGAVISSSGFTQPVALIPFVGPSLGYVNMQRNSGSTVLWPEATLALVETMAQVIGTVCLTTAFTTPERWFQRVKVSAVVNGNSGGLSVGGAF